MRKTTNRLLAMLLAFCMVISIMPVSVFAEAGEGNPAAEENTVIEAVETAEEFEGEDSNDFAGTVAEEAETEDVSEEESAAAAVQVEEIFAETTDSEISGVIEPVDAETVFATDEFYFSLALNDDDMTCTITAFQMSGGTVKDVEIPETFTVRENEYTVTAIGQYAFAGKGITSVTIPDTVVSIGAGAFYNHNMTSVALPANLQTIGDNAFYRGTSGGLTSLTIPESVTSIGNGAFYYNNIQGTLTIPASVQTIGSEAFTYNRITSLLFEDGSQLTDLGYNAFYENSITGELILPAGITDVPGQCFYRNALTSVVLAQGTTNIGYYAFSSNSSLVSLSNFEDITNVGYGAFSGCYLLDFDFSEMAALKTIESYAFSGCSALDADISQLSELTAIGESAFSGCTDLGNATNGIYLPSNLTSVGNDAFWYVSNTVYAEDYYPGELSAVGEAVDFGTGMNIIFKDVFTSGEGYKWLVAPDGVIYGPKSANMPGYDATLVAATELTVPSSLSGTIDGTEGTLQITQLGKVALQSGINTQATTVRLADGISAVNDYAFYNFKYGNNTLSTLYIPSSLVNMTESALRGVNSLTDVYVDQAQGELSGWDKCWGAPNWKAGCVHTSGVSPVVIHWNDENVDTPEMDYICTADGWHVRKSDGTVIGYYGEKTAITESDWPHVLTAEDYPQLAADLSVSSAEGTFHYNYCYYTTENNVEERRGTEVQITSVEIPSWITNIGYNTFYGQSRLKSADLSKPESLSFNGFAFAYTGLEKIVITPNVEYLGYGTFSSCTELSEIVFSEGCKFTYISDNVFSYCTALTEIAFPDSITYISSSVFNGCTNLETVYIGSKTTYVGEQTLNNCPNLKEIYVDQYRATALSNNWGVAINAPYGADGAEVIWKGEKINFSADREQVKPGEWKIKLQTASDTNVSPTQKIWQTDAEGEAVLNLLISRQANASYELNVTESGTYYFAAMNDTGRINYYSFTIEIDKVPPVITAELTSYEGNDVIKITVSDDRDLASLAGTDLETVSYPGNEDLSDVQYVEYDPATAKQYKFTVTDAEGWTADAYVAVGGFNLSFNANAPAEGYNITVPDAVYVAAAAENETAPIWPAVDSGYDLADLDLYDFEGWYTSAEGGAKFEGGTEATESIEVYAHWSRNSKTYYTVEYYCYDLDFGGFFVIDTDKPLVDISESPVAINPEDTTIANKYSGYHFDADADNVLSGELDMDGSLVLKVYYSLSPFSLTYDANAGEDTVTGMPDPLKIENIPAVKGQTAVVSDATPTREGYTFKGWAYESSKRTAAVKANDIIPVNFDVVLYAVWREPYVVTFDANADGENIEVPDSISVTATDSAMFSVPYYYPVREGYRFLRWNDKADGSGTNYYSWNGYGINDDLTLYAIWEDCYTITYAANLTGETVYNMPSPGQSFKQNDAYYFTLTAESPVSTYYRFLGWTEHAEYSAQDTLYVYDNVTGQNTYQIYGNLTLYAQWDRVPVITYMNTDNTVFSTVFANHDKQNEKYWFELLAEGPAAEGNMFLNWKDAEEKQYVYDYENTAANIYEISEDLTLYPVTRTAFTVTYHANAGSDYVWNMPGNGYSAKSAEGYVFTLPSNTPGRNEYRFIGWSESAQYTPEEDTLYVYDSNASNKYVIDRDIDLYAQWELVPKVYYMNSDNTLYTSNVTSYDYSEEAYYFYLYYWGPAPERYMFMSWKDAGENNYIYDYSNNEANKYYISEDLYLYPVTMQAYTITYHANAGDDSVSNMPGTEYSYRSNGNTVFFLTIYVPERVGRVFIGWSLTQNYDPDEDTLYVYDWRYNQNEYPISENIDLYAQWKRVPYVSYLNSDSTVFYNQNTTLDVENNTYYFTLIADEPYEDGKIFLNWKDGDDDTYQFNYDDSTANRYYISEDLILYPVTMDAYSVTYHENAGADYVWNMPETGYAYKTGEGLFFNLCSLEPGRSGYRFLGWTENPVYNEEDTLYKYDTVNWQNTYQISGNIDFYAQWEKIPVVTYLHSDGSLFTTQYANYEEETGRFYFYLSSGNWEYGKIFLKWQDTEENDWIYDDSDAAANKYYISEDFTLRAVVRDAYTITYHINTGNPNDGDVWTIDYEQKYNGKNGFWLNSGLTREGNVLLGWTENAEYNEEDTLYVYKQNGGEDNFYSISGNLDLYAQWETAPSLIYHANSGNDYVYIYPEIGDVRKTEDSEYVFDLTSNIPSRRGYEFLGWTENAEYDPEDKLYVYDWSNPDANTYPISDDMDLYAQWAALPKITYHDNADGDKVIDMPGNDYAQKSGENEYYFYVTSAVPIRSGYVFIGWTENARYKDGDILYKYDSITWNNPAVYITEDFDLYAQWKPAPKLIYHANAGDDYVSNIPEIGEVKETNDGKGFVFILTGNTPYRDGYDFLGWTENAEYDPEDTEEIMYNWVSGSKEDNTYPISDDMDLYAQWYKKPTVTYHADEATENDKYDYPRTESTYRDDQGYYFSLTYDKPVRFGYRFIGWSETEEYDPESGTLHVYNENWEANRYYITEDIDLYARWEDCWEIKYVSGFTEANEGNFDIRMPDSQYFDIPEEESLTVTIDAGDFRYDDCPFEFLGWWPEETMDEDDVPYQDRAEITITGDTILYAQWKIPFELNFTYDVEKTGVGQRKVTLNAKLVPFEGTDLIITGIAFFLEDYYREFRDYESADYSDEKVWIGQTRELTASLVADVDFGAIYNAMVILSDFTMMCYEVPVPIDMLPPTATHELDRDNNKILLTVTDIEDVEKIECEKLDFSQSYTGSEDKEVLAEVEFDPDFHGMYKFVLTDREGWTADYYVPVNGYTLTFVFAYGDKHDEETQTRISLPKPVFVDINAQGAPTVWPDINGEDKDNYLPDPQTFRRRSFAGWATNDGTLFKADTPITKDETVYTKWEYPDDKVEVEVCYDLYIPEVGEFVEYNPSTASFGREMTYFVTNEGQLIAPEPVEIPGYRLLTSADDEKYSDLLDKDDESFEDDWTYQLNDWSSEAWVRFYYYPVYNVVNPRTDYSEAFDCPMFVTDPESGEKITVDLTAKKTEDGGFIDEDNGYLYAGYFGAYSAETGFTSPYTISGKELMPVAGKTYYIKEINSADYFKPRTLVTSLNDEHRAFMLAIVDGIDFSEIGFSVKVSVAGVDSSSTLKLNELSADKVYENLSFTKTTGDTVAYDLSDIRPKNSQIEIGKIMSVELDGYDGYEAAVARKETVSISVTPYYITLDGVKVTCPTTRSITPNGTVYPVVFDKVGDVSTEMTVKETATTNCGIMEYESYTPYATETAEVLIPNGEVPVIEPETNEEPEAVTGEPAENAGNVWENFFNGIGNALKGIFG